MMKWMIFVFLALVVPMGRADSQGIGLLPCSANSLSVTAASGNVQLSRCGPVLILMNIGSAEAFYTFGGTSALAVATISNFSLPPNSFQQVIVGANAEWLAAITASSTTTLRLVQGTVP